MWGGVVVGAEPAGAQIGEAACRGGGPVWARAAAARLPFHSNSFDGAVACLVFEHITEVDEAIREVARVLRPGGRFALFLNHPLLWTPNSGWIVDQILDPQSSTGGWGRTWWNRLSTRRSVPG